MTMLSSVWPPTRWFRIFGGLVLLSLNAGCNNDPLGLQPVTGSVTVDGKPAAGVRLVFCPVNTSPEAMNQRPMGTTDEQGKYSLTTFVLGDGAPPGDYKISATWLSASKQAVVDERGSVGTDRFMNKYAIPDQSGLTATIAEDTSELPVMEFKLPRRR
jgi:hypothetical protein